MLIPLLRPAVLALLALLSTMTVGYGQLSSARVVTGQGPSWSVTATAGQVIPSHVLVTEPVSVSVGATLAKPPSFTQGP